MIMRSAPIRQLIYLIELISILSAIPAQAACTGSGTTWSCPAGASVSDVNNVVSSASDGATVTFAGGSYNWGSVITPSLSKGISFICASTCTVSSGGTTFGFPSGSSSKLYRISGFNFTSAGGLVWTCPAGGCSGTLGQFRFDHNTCTGISASSTVITIGENTSKQYVY